MEKVLILIGSGFIGKTVFGVSHIIASITDNVILTELEEVKNLTSFNTHDSLQLTSMLSLAVPTSSLITRTDRNSAKSLITNNSHPKQMNRPIYSGRKWKFKKR